MMGNILSKGRTLLSRMPGANIARGAAKMGGGALQRGYQAAMGTGPGIRSGLNRGFNSFSALSGAGTLRRAGGHYRSMFAQMGVGSESAAGISRGFGGARMREWATGADVFGPKGGFRPMKYGLGAARVGGAAAGVSAGADFLNPWGFGWGD